MVSSILLVPGGIISLISPREYQLSGYSPRVSLVWLVLDGVKTDDTIED
jgi:hypothetical protein